jgi:hypothetical protein
MLVESSQAEGLHFGHGLPLANSPGYHTFRHWCGWSPVNPEKRLGFPA